MQVDVATLPDNFAQTLQRHHLYRKLSHGVAVELKHLSSLQRGCGRRACASASAAACALRAAISAAAAASAAA
eukprot:6148068-Pleurochrysis_carterae.AAC.1